MMRSHEPATEEDYGLLVAAATVAAEATARTVRDLLRDNGIRATIGPAQPARHRVLVFPEDAVRAFEILCDNTI